MMQKSVKMLNSFGTICYRHMQCTKRTDRIRNEDILLRIKWQLLINSLYVWQLQALGQWLRATTNLVSRFTLYQWEHGENGRRLPRMIYIKNKTSNRKQLLNCGYLLWTEWKKKKCVGLYGPQSQMNEYINK